MTLNCVRFIAGAKKIARYEAKHQDVQDSYLNRFVESSYDDVLKGNEKRKNNIHELVCE